MKKLEKVDTHLGTFYGFEGDLITQQLHEFGAHQRNELAMLMSVVRVGDVVLDVGANIGTFSIPLARKVGASGCVCAFEGDVDIYGILKRNVVENDMAACIEATNAIVTQDAGSFRKVLVKDNAGATHFERSSVQDDVGPAAISIDQWYESSRISDRSVNVIKIDVEGMDADVLFSCREVIEKYKPVIYIEISQSQLRKNGSSSAEVDNFLRDMGYDFFRNIGARNTNNDNYIIAKLSKIRAGGSFFDLLAIPSNSDRYPVNPKGIGYTTLWRIRQIPKKVLGKSLRLVSRGS